MEFRVGLVETLPLIVFVLFVSYYIIKKKFFISKEVKMENRNELLLNKEKSDLVHLPE